MNALNRALESQMHPTKALPIRIVAALWPELGDRGPGPVSTRMHEVQDVLDGLPVPTMSQKDREAILRVAGELGGAP